MKKKCCNKKERGITLIALVITIIVLLILAGISIVMLTGENGILARARNSKERTERIQVIETAKLDILGKQTENKGDLSEEELIDILTSDNYNTKGTLSDNNEETIFQKTLTSNDGKYQILVSEIYNGDLKNTKVVAGLYNADTAELIYSWEELLELGNIITVNGTTLTRNAFNVGNIMVKLVVDESITNINNLAGISQLKEIYIPATVTSVSMPGNSNLETIKIANRSELTTIGSGAFTGCGKLKNINIPSSVTSIGNNAFAGCSSLTDITIPESVTSIGANAYYESTYLRTYLNTRSIAALRYDWVGSHRDIEVENIEIRDEIVGYATDLFELNDTKLEKMHIGDYVNFGVDYDNLFTNNANNDDKPDDSYSGKWRVLNITSNKIQIISAGVPARYNHNGSTSSDVELYMNRLFNWGGSGTNPGFISEVGFKDNLGNRVSIGSVYSLLSGANGGCLDGTIRNLTKTDITSIASGNNGPYLNFKYGLISVPSGNECAQLWLGDKGGGTYLQYMKNDGTVNICNDSSMNSYELGIRPVVTLKSTIKYSLNNINSNGIATWDIINE